MNRVISVLLIFIILILTCCSACKRKKCDKCLSDDCQDIYVAVLCDVTKSVDTTVAPRIQQTAGEIYETFDNNAHFKYYIINDADYNSAFFDSAKISLCKDRPSQKRTFMANNKLRVKRIKDTLKFISKNNEYQNTSITLAMNNVFEDLKEFSLSHPKAKLKLVILSDMIEDTKKAKPDSRFGILNMVDDEGVKAVKKSLESDFIVDSNYNFQKLGVRIYLVYESENKVSKKGKVQTSAFKGELEDAWRMIFQRFGYSRYSDSVKQTFLGLPGSFKQ